MGNATPRGGISEQDALVPAPDPRRSYCSFSLHASRGGLGVGHTGFVSGGALPASCSKKPGGTRVGVGGVCGNELLSFSPDVNTTTNMSCKVRFSKLTIENGIANKIGPDKMRVSLT